MSDSPGRTATPAASAKSKSRAARSEKKPAPKTKAEADQKTIEWEGLTLTLPDELPGALLFTFDDLSTRGDVFAVLDLLKVMVGGDQYQQIRALVTDRGLNFEKMEEALSDLLEKVLGPFGVSLGESEASTESS